MFKKWVFISFLLAGFLYGGDVGSSVIKQEVLTLDEIFKNIQNDVEKYAKLNKWNIPLWIDEIEMAVPMGPDQVLEKRKGIFKHQSQKDGVVFQGADSREFWQRAEDRNRETAELYDQLGLSHYAAMEAFVRWHY